MSASIRPAAREDAATILALIRELATYEKEPDAVEATLEDLLRDGFGERPLFRTLLAEQAGEVVGMALYFDNYSTWKGRRGIYLEELFVRPSARGQGIGRALLVALARELIALGGARLDLSVLDWNELARGVYAKLGFEDMESWRPYRLTGAALERLAGS
jgi:GNAT superfamily N-acetyltransferase